MSESIYPKINGPPTKEGLYEMRRGLRVEFGRVIARDLVDMPCIQVQWTGGYCTLASVAVCEGWIFYGPIHPPTTGERQPCGAWRLGDCPSRGRGGVWLLFVGVADSIAEVWLAKDGSNWACFAAGWTDYGYSTKEAAQLAAEDAIWAECAARMAVIMGGK